MINRLYVKNLDDDATLYNVGRGTNGMKCLHLYDDCRLIQDSSYVAPKKAATQFDDTRICIPCSERFVNSEERVFISDNHGGAGDD